MVYDFPIYFFKVKYEGTNVVKLLEFCVRNGRSKWTVTRAKYKEVMSFVREFCPFIVDVKLVFGIDKEGDEIPFSDHDELGALLENCAIDGEDRDEDEPEPTRAMTIIVKNPYANERIQQFTSEPTNAEQKTAPLPVHVTLSCELEHALTKALDAAAGRSGSLSINHCASCSSQNTTYQVERQKGEHADEEASCAPAAAEESIKAIDEGKQSECSIDSVGSDDWVALLGDCEHDAAPPGEARADTVLSP